MLTLQPRLRPAGLAAICLVAGQVSLAAPQGGATYGLARPASPAQTATETLSPSDIAERYSDSVVQILAEVGDAVLRQGTGFPLSIASSGNQELRVRFIGNSGFEFSDGEVTVLVDFPYESGAYGYMTFDADELHSRTQAVCLFTHHHADHFDPGELERVGCSVAGPSEVLSAVSQTLHLKGGPTWRLGQASIRCLQSEHGDVDHCSYIIQWHGRTILVSGDVEELEGILSEQDRIDAIFIPSWLASEAPRVLAKFPRARIVISHHRADEVISSCSDCLVLSPGDSMGL